MVTHISKANAKNAVACYHSYGSQNDDETTGTGTPVPPPSSSLPQQAYVLSPAPQPQQHHSPLCKADQYNLLPPIDLDDDMEFLCQTMRLNDNTRVLLTYFDARTVEDFALMTEFDFTAMMEHSARFGRPFPPLQQRKVAVLSKWLREIMMQQTCRRHNHGPFVEKKGADVSEFRRFTISAKIRRESECRQAKKGDHHDAHDGSDSTSDTADDIEMMTISQRFQANKDDEIYSLLPPNWKEEFQTDLPRLKANLRKEGEERSSWSACTEAVLSLRWIIFGYND